MSSALVVPFNFQPESTSVRTSSYTIPTGKYAKVDVQCIGGGTFTIDGATALSSSSWSVLASDNMRMDANNYLTTGANGTIGGVGGAFNENTAYDNQTQTFWLPSGAVINGTGTWRAVVQIYSNIT